MTELPCKVCGGAVDSVGSVPFGRTVRSERAVQPTHDLIDFFVSYVRCRSCGFLFTRDFDEWTDEDFIKHVYNDEYVLVDPECQRERPAANARSVADLVGSDLRSARVLDHGSWDGEFERRLREDHGARHVDSHDGLLAPNLRAGELYDVVTCFETLEHLTRPQAVVREVREHLQPAGRAILTTVLQPEPHPGLDWWYVGPRNGHVSLFSRMSIRILFDRCGMDVRSVGGLLHIATRRS